MEHRKGDDWVPLWIDKWLFGSTRIELNPNERSVWIDLLALAGKDEGYIRANKDVPYNLTQLAGLFNIPLELLETTIKKCIKTDKLIKNKNGTYKIKSWENYELSKRHKRRIRKEKKENKSKRESKRGTKKTDTVSEKADIEEEKKEKEIYCQFVDCWNKLADKTGLTAKKKLSSTHKQWINKAIEVNPDFLADFKKACDKILHSTVLKTESWVKFEFMVKVQNAQNGVEKILEGTYDWKEKQQHQRKSKKNTQQFDQEEGDEYKHLETVYED